MKNFCRDVKYLVYIIIVLFGMGSWIAVNGIFVELPVIVEQLPEGWSLPSYMTIIVQIANIGPLAYMVWNLFNPNKPYERQVVFLMVSVGSAATLLMAFYWKKTSVVAGGEHSTALFVLLFILSLVDCTSSVVFLPFMNTFKPVYMTSYYIGGGFSGLLPSLVALAQGVGEVECQNISRINATSNETEYTTESVYLPAIFSVQDFFIFVFAMMVTCGIAFALLNYLPYCKTEHVNGAGKNVYKVNKNTCNDKINVDEKPELEVDVMKYMSVTLYIYYLVLIAWANALTNSVVLSVQSYACLPYGSKPYHLAATLSNIANPVACFIAFFLPSGNFAGISAITFVGTIVSAYIMMLASMSPTPILIDTNAGGILVVAAYVIVLLTLTFTKVCIAQLLRHEGRKALLWCGAFTQIGSLLGSIVMFVLVNVYEIFEQKYQCA